MKEELEKILTEYGGRVLTYTEMARRQHHDSRRYDADIEHAKKVALTSITNLVDKEICSMYEYTLTDIEKLEYQTKTEHPMISKTKLRAKLKGVRL